MLALLSFALLACSTDAPTPAEPAAEPAHLPEPEPAAEPPAAPAGEHTVQLAFGAQCEEPVAGEPTTIEEVRTAMLAAGVQPSTVEVLPTCEACSTCPRVAFAITSPADAAALLKVFPTAKH